MLLISLLLAITAVRLPFLFGDALGGMKRAIRGAGTWQNFKKKLDAYVIYP